MSRKLILLCQGKGDSSASPSGVRKGDLSQPLSDKGKRNAQRVGVWMAQHYLAPHEIVCSPTERAVVTTEKATKALGLGVHNLRINHNLLNADVKGLTKELSALPDSSDQVLLVARKKDIEALLHYLTGQHEKMQATSLAVLSLDKKWSKMKQGCAELSDILHAPELPIDFPFPDIQGRERRSRPAYYYQQSSVIPYRFKNKQLEFLLIGSSNQQHLVVPKGILEPGLTAQDSAAKEAYYEAGIEGRVADDAIGVYEYEKWDATCQVTVFAMEVLRVMAKKEWHESHRGRDWYSVKQAMKKVNEPALVSMMEQLSESLTK